MDEVKDWMWLVKTEKGDFFISVAGKWTEKEASMRLQGLFKIVLKLDIISMIPRKRSTGSGDNTGTIYEIPDSVPGADFNFIAGKKLWEACGRGAEFEAEMLLLKNGLKDGV